MGMYLTQGRFMSDSYDPLKSFTLTIEKSRENFQQIESSFNDLDSRFNFKVNSLLKAEFEKICLASHSNPSRELKLFMLDVVRKGRI